ncbi:annexin A7-like [Pomacea canaliculata]|uniref:annexin A7-like n=1 Tax=Pomacea canaliculata TaxID=400727 RepID=UPI000D727A29|nr:annexin A7-like [Pomacea canaliculata]
MEEVMEPILLPMPMEFHMVDIMEFPMVDIMEFPMEDILRLTHLHLEWECLVPLRGPTPLLLQHMELQVNSPILVHTLDLLLLPLMVDTHRLVLDQEALLHLGLVMEATQVSTHQGMLVLGAHPSHDPASGLPPAMLAPSGGITAAAPHGTAAVPAGVEAIGAGLDRVTLDGCAQIFRPTVVASPNFSAERDSETLRKSMKGAGTDERTIIGIIGKRCNTQRQEIAKIYKTMYGRDLIADLESELSGNFRETIMGMFKPPAYYDAWSLNHAMEGLGTKESVLIEILCTRSNQQIRDIVACYKEHFKRDLEKDISDDTSGHFKKLLISCCQGNRQELTPEQLSQVRSQGASAVVNAELARQDAQKLQEAGIKHLGTDESTFISVLALRHMYQLQATFSEYQKLTGKDILDSISSETSGDFETGLRAIVRSAKNRPEYFADKLHDSIKGLGTDDSRLIRIIVSRCEIDLQDIKDAYLTKYQKTLDSEVASDTSGDYKRILLALIGS